MSIFFTSGLPACDGRHDVYNGGVYAVASDHWVNTFSRKGTELAAKLVVAHLVIVDTSVNDYFDLKNNPAVHAEAANAERSMKLTEIIIRQLLALPSKPTVLYLGTSAHFVPRRKEDDPGTLIKQQCDVAGYYGIPCVSLMDGIGLVWSRELLDWFERDFRSDGGCHPTILGHRMIASTLLGWLELHASGKRKTWPERTIPPLKYTSESVLSEYLRTSRYVDATTEAYISSPAGAWGVIDEGRGNRRKPGLISNTVGSSVLWHLAPHTTDCTSLHIEYLRSYEHMGKFEVSLCNGTSITLDGRWDAHQSELQTDVLVSSMPANGDLCVKVKVLESGRHENKVKITSLSFF